MPAVWLQIRQARQDITDYLIHWTRGVYDGEQHNQPFDILKSIIQCGLLKPTFAPRHRITVGGTENTIKGSSPAVCFTEQPLYSFIKSCEYLSDRYHPYAIAVRKDRLYEFGGLPVIYGDVNLLDSLHDEWKYLWVRYNPIPNESLGGYPIDWTHEREWRAKSRKYNYIDYGSCPDEGVPLLLPPKIESGKKSLWYLPWVIVKTKEEVDDIHNFISTLSPYSGENKVINLYHSNLLKVPVISLSEVEEHLKENDTRWSRLDTLPLEEVDKSVKATLTRLGWRDMQGSS